MNLKEIYNIQYNLKNIKNIAKKIVNLLELKTPKIVILSGEPGAGKSTLCNEIINLIEDKKVITQSPTFTKIQEYEKVIHMDLYMMNKNSNYNDYLLNYSDKLILIEWGENFIDYINNDFTIKIEYLENNENERIITIYSIE